MKKYFALVLSAYLMFAGVANGQIKWNDFGEKPMPELSEKNGYILVYSIEKTTIIKKTVNTKASSSAPTSSWGTSPGGDGLGDVQRRSLEQWWWQEQMERWIYELTVQQSHDGGMSWTTVSSTTANQGQPGYKAPPPSEEPPSDDD